jgi:uroporphyrinogen-III decarboxylase
MRPKLEQLIDTLLIQMDSSRNKAKNNRPKPSITCYLENLGWVQYLKYDMNDYFEDPEFNCEIQLKQKLIQFERFDDDSMLSNWISASTGMYFEYTLLGMYVSHQSDGVPLIQSDHPLTKKPDLSIMKRHDFYTTGEMPHIFQLYEDLRAISKDRLNVGFPRWERGPLDMAIQLRGYEQFIDDTMKRPQFVHELMQYIIEERIRWWDAYCKHFNTKDRLAGIGDDWTYLPFISPSIFEEFVFPYYKKLEEYHGGIGWIHSCGSKVKFQKRLEELKGLGGHEINHWTNVEDAVANASPDKYLSISLINVDVQLVSQEQMIEDLVRIKNACKGRSYGITAAAIEKIHDDFEYDIRQVQIWLEVAKRVLRDGY